MLCTHLPELRAPPFSVVCVPRLWKVYSPACIGSLAVAFEMATSRKQLERRWLEASSDSARDRSRASHVRFPNSVLFPRLILYQHLTDPLRLEHLEQPQRHTAFLILRATDNHGENQGGLRALLAFSCTYRRAYACCNSAFNPSALRRTPQLLAPRRRKRRTRNSSSSFWRRTKRSRPCSTSCL